MCCYTLCAVCCLLLPTQTPAFLPLLSLSFPFPFPLLVLSFLQTMINEFHRIGLPNPIADVLLRFEEKIRYCRDASNLRDSGVLNPLESPETLSMPVNNPRHHDLLYVLTSRRERDVVYRLYRCRTWLCLSMMACVMRGIWSVEWEWRDVVMRSGEMQGSNLFPLLLPQGTPRSTTRGPSTASSSAPPPWPTRVTWPCSV